MKDISIHDNALIGYEVFCDRCVIILHTEYRDRKPVERTDIIFSGVEAYHFVGDNMQTILFDIAETTIEKILRQFAAEFQTGIKYCWPGPWNDSPDGCVKFLRRKQCAGWTILSSYGGGGFVIAKKLELKRAG
jgi:hypothetical protein